MDKVALIGLDLGTTSCKVVCYTHEGLQIAEASSSYELSHPVSGWAELDPDHVLAAVCEVLASVEKPLAMFDRLALAVSAQGEAFVLTDAKGHALTRIPVSMDMRGSALISEFKDRQDVRDASGQSGHGLTSLTSFSKLLWFRQNEAALLERASRFLCVGEFFMAQLGLDPVMDHSMAARSGMFDFDQQVWATGLIELAGLPSKMLPPLAPSGTPVGVVPASRMERFGLARDVLISTGGHDQACAVLGAGASNLGTGLFSTGTTEAVALACSKPLPQVGHMNLFPYPHVVADMSILLFGTQNGGRVLDWLSVLLGNPDKAAILDELPRLPSQIVSIPHFAGSGSIVNDDSAHAIVHGMGYETDQGAFALAVLESITMEQAEGLVRLKEAGIDITELRAVGGSTRSDRWMQIKADVLNRPVCRLAQPDTACTGSAILAGIGAGVLRTVTGIEKLFAKPGRTFVPRPEFAQIYSMKRDLARAIYAQASELQHRFEDLKAAVTRLHEIRKG
ncbi:FGGY-family carbohydrate kinase [Labrenzia sp. DG1229]|uniref:FGGY-family carbohydrate kinase n=1 Tax=Labrenzia sp. DG1229 TaxID=681847 RepID=UPI000490F5DA|nr:FGGY-family carbohydrate kinase [Labrenzia sp. DG1229]